MGSMSLLHWLVVFLVLFLFLGRDRLRHLGRDLGKTVRDFQAALQEESSTQDNAAPEKKEK